MPRGDKSAYTAKQRRQAEHIEEGYKRRGVPEKEAERRAWATENAMTGGGRKSGTGRCKKINKAPGRTAAATRKRRASSAGKRSSRSTARRSTSRKRSRSR